MPGPGPRRGIKEKESSIMDFKISREELYRWCSIPWQDLEKQPDLKTKLVIKEDRASDRKSVV